MYGAPVGKCQVTPSSSDTAPKLFPDAATRPSDAGSELSVNAPGGAAPPPTMAPGARTSAGAQVLPSSVERQMRLAAATRIAPRAVSTALVTPAPLRPRLSSRCCAARNVVAGVRTAPCPRSISREAAPGVSARKFATTSPEPSKSDLWNVKTRPVPAPWIVPTGTTSGRSWPCASRTWTRTVPIERLSARNAVSACTSV